MNAKTYLHFAVAGLLIAFTGILGSDLQAQGVNGIWDRLSTPVVGTWVLEVQADPIGCPPGQTGCQPIVMPPAPCLMVLDWHGRVQQTDGYLFPGSHVNAPFFVGASVGFGTWERLRSKPADGATHALTFKNLLYKPVELPDGTTMLAAVGMKTVRSEFAVEVNPGAPEEALRRTINGTWEAIMTDMTGTLLGRLTGTVTGHPLLVEPIGQ